MLHRIKLLANNDKTFNPKLPLLGFRGEVLHNISPRKLSYSCTMPQFAGKHWNLPKTHKHFWIFSTTQ